MISTYLLFLVLFILFCVSRFSSDSISLQSEENYFIFLVVQMCWRQILPAFISLICSYFLKKIFSGYNILVWLFFSFQHFKDGILLSFGLVFFFNEKLAILLFLWPFCLENVMNIWFIFYSHQFDVFEDNFLCIHSA